jgi:hypothetical protein
MNSRYRPLTWLPGMLVVALIGILIGCGGSTPTDDEAFLARVRGAADSLDESASEAGILPGTSQDPDSLPVIDVSTTYIDVGEIPRHEITMTTMSVRNSGKATLVINDIKTTCGCTVGQVKDNRIPPGGETVLDVAVDPSKFGFESTKMLTIFSNDPSKSRVEIQVHAKVEPEFVFEPEVLDFGSIDKGQAASQTILVRQGTDEELTLLSAQPQRPVEWLEVTHEERSQDLWQDPDKREYLVHVALKPTAPPGPLNARVSLRSNFKRASINNYPVMVTGKIHAFYQVAPPSIVNLGHVAPGRTVQNVLRVFADEPFEIVSASATPPGVDFIPHREGDGNTVAFNAVVADDLAPGPFSGVAEIVLRNGQKEYTEMIKLAATVQGPLANVVPVAPASEELRPVLDQ